MIGTDVWAWLNQRPFEPPLYFWLVLSLWMAFGAPSLKLEDYRRWYHKLTSSIARIPMPARRGHGR